MAFSNLGIAVKVKVCVHNLFLNFKLYLNILTYNGEKNKSYN